MKTPNHLKIKHQCKRAIPLLVKKFNLEKADEIQLNSSGMVNPCFFVGQELVFRFNTRDPSIPKFQRERIIFERLINSSTPVPKVVGWDTSKELVDYDVFITSRLPGKNIKENWETLERNKQISLARSAGRMLRELHDNSFDRYGEISGLNPFPKTDDWLSYLDFKLDYHLKKIMQLKIFSLEIVNKFRAVFNSFSDIISMVTEAKLVHADYHLGNLLYKDNEITGVLDFEWSFAGDPIYDLCRWKTADADWPGSQVPFFEGYGRKLTSYENQRISFYQMIRNLEMSVVAKLHFGEEEARDYQQTTYKQMINLAKIIPV